MKNGKNKLFILIGVNVSLIILIVMSVVFLLQPQIVTNTINKKVGNVQKLKETVDVFLDEQRSKYRPSALSDYIGNTAVGIPILMYHDVVPQELEEYDGNKLAVDRFREHMRYLAENDYRTLTVAEFDQFFRGEIEVPEKSVLVTFDDGFKSVKELIEPILEEYNLHAVSFIIGEKTVNEPEWFVTPEDILELKPRNFIEFQSHSYVLHNSGSNGRGKIETISSEEMLDDVAKENSLIGSTEMFCYPFGHTDESATSMLTNSNISYGVTTAFGYATRDSNPLLLPRVRINANTTVETFASLIKY